jgi:predicted amidophosphoribosyltransferase
MLSQLESLLRSCSYCGLTFGRTDIYCKKCWDKLFKDYKPPAVFVPLQVPVRTLFLWKRNDKSRIEHLVRTLKVARFIEGYVPLAKELCYQFSYVKNACFVPIPPSIEGQSDHADLLAQALAEVSDQQFRRCLRWRFKGSSQKLKTRSERMRVKIELEGDVDDHFKYILVDDVVTTGSTAKAAIKALGPNKNIELWTVACRPKELLI